MPEATLRAWERRYRVPVPVRTASGYRLYTDEEVEVVRRMSALCGEGMSPADAAKLLRAPQPRATASERRATADKLSADPHDALAGRIVAATRQLDASAIEAAVRLAMTVSDARSVVERIFCPALAEIGREWERGVIGVGHEHLASGDHRWEPPATCCA